MKEVKKKRIGYLDALRVIAALAVIIIHVSAARWNAAPSIHSNHMFITMVLNTITRWAVPLFVMISGALLLDPKKPFSIRKFYRKNILRIVITFLVWSVFYMVFNWKVLKFSPGSIQGAIASVIEGSYHMWFLYMLLGLYVVTPVLRLITANRRMLSYFLFIGILITFIIPGILHIATVGTMVSTNPYMRTIKDILTSVTTSMHFSFAGSYVIYYLLGYYLRTEVLSKLQRYIIYALGILGAAFGCVVTYKVSVITDTKYTCLSEYLPWILAMTTALFVFFRYNCEKIGNSKVVRLFASASFGIYLLHAAVLEVVTKNGIFNTLTYDWFLYLLSIVIIFAVSFGITWILQKIPLVKKIVS
ncbi:MAG: acyltransferase family protein [Candidatus Saccharibacteria bacterium]|nr:acyltransferase family protein [Candidatus Saccharibacteria bacterium]